MRNYCLRIIGILTFFLLFSCEEVEFTSDYIVNRVWTEVYTIDGYRALDGYIYNEVSVAHSVVFYKDLTGVEFFTYSYYSGRGNFYQDEYKYPYDWFWVTGPGLSDNVTLNFLDGNVAYMQDLSRGYVDGADMLYCTYDVPGEVPKKMVLFAE